MKILVVGSGGREHALVKKFKESSSVSEVHCVPGNALIDLEAKCHPGIKGTDVVRVSQLAQQLKVDLVFVGPEDPLVFGLSDELRRNGIPVFGPSQQGAELEGSKNFCKEFLVKHSVPTARYERVSSVAEVQKLVDDSSRPWPAPYVLKADGLAAGKGVVICATKAELLGSARRFFDEKLFGEASKTAVLEEFLDGYELSVLALTTGEDFVTLPVAQDHKRLKEGNAGPNTGGMGTIAPMPVDASLMSVIETGVIAPTVRGLKQDGILYRGVLFFGIMVTSRGPQVLEINVRFGDPETQVILPLLEGDFAQACLQIARGELPQLLVKPNLAASCVVVAAAGYPDDPRKGDVIRGLPDSLGKCTASSYWIGAGVAQSAQNDFISSGGRVLGAVGLASNLKDALSASYRLVASIDLPGMQFRRDIGSGGSR